MERYTQTNTIPETQREHESSRIIDYADLMDVVQLSIARQLALRGADEAEHFTEVIADLSPEKQVEAIREVGRHYDEALTSFVIGSLVARRQRNIVILAEASEGIDGYLPWERTLQERIQKCQNQGMLRDAHVRVERFHAVDDKEIATVLGIPTQKHSA